MYRSSRPKPSMRSVAGAPYELYRLAMSYNRGLDRDKDGIACEKT